MEQSDLKELCRRLLEYNPDIVEIIQFGSSTISSAQLVKLKTMKIFIKPTSLT